MNGELVVIEVKDVELKEKINELCHKVYSHSQKNPPSFLNDQDILNDIVLAFFKNTLLIGSISLSVPKNRKVGTQFKWIPKVCLATTGGESKVKKLPNPNNTLEVGRFFVIEEARSFDVFRKIFQEVHRYLRYYNCSHILISSDDRLEKLYERISFKKTGFYYYKQQIESKMKLNILSAQHKHFGVYGLFSGPIKWCLFMRPVILEDKKKTLTNLGELIVFCIYSLFSPFVENVLIPWIRFKSLKNKNQNQINIQNQNQNHNQNQKKGSQHVTTSSI